MNLFQEAKNILDKDGKVNPLGPYGKSKLTGRETSTYFRRNKVKDANIKKAVEVALDLGGAYDIASKEIKKFYGDKVLRSKEVQQALSYANEEVQEEVQEAFSKTPKSGVEVAKMMMKSKTMKGFANKVKKMKTVTAVQLDKMLPDYVSGGDIGAMFEDAEAKAKLNLKHTQDMEKLKAKQAREKEAMSEDYRKLAKYGMGTETSKSARVGLELDFYDSKGNKQFGKILQRTNTGYLVKDSKGKKHVLKYLDRKKAKDMLKPNYIHTESNIEEGKLHVKMFTGKDPAGIKVKQVGSDPRGGRDVMMTGPDNKLIAYAVRSLGVDKAIAKKGLKAVQKELGDMIGEEFKDVDKAKKNPFKALGFSQHPHKGFEGERMPKGMRDFRTKALTPTQIKKQMNVMDSYRAMWEDGEKYAPVDENVERGIMKKMRKGRVAKGMPR